jgi:signal peptidase I
MVKNELELETKSVAKKIVDALLYVWDIGKTLFLVVAVAFVIRFYLVQPFYVEGQSMEPNFNNGEYLLIDELSYHFRSPERGEVIVFRPPINTYQNYIKRIIGLPGESVSFDGSVTVKNDKNPEGSKIEESYLSPDTPTIGNTYQDLKEKEFFAMGDNRTQSSDSRIFGPVNKKNITGRAWLFIKIEPWKVFHLGKKTITIPKFKAIGRVQKPTYSTD